MYGFWYIRSRKHGTDFPQLVWIAPKSVFVPWQGDTQPQAAAEPELSVWQMDVCVLVSMPDTRYPSSHTIVATEPTVLSAVFVYVAFWCFRSSLQLALAPTATRMEKKEKNSKLNFMD